MKVKEIKDTSGRVVSYIIDNTTYVVPIEGVVEYELIKQWIAQGNTPEPEFTELEIQTNLLNQQIQKAKTYLSTTSWIWEKYNRNVLALKDITDAEFQTKYQDIILAQEEARLNINKLEKELVIVQESEVI